jgi:hypothetical protein
MQLKQIALACAAFAALPAFAAAPAGGAFGTPDLVVRMSGATAPDQYLQAIAERVFEPGFYRYFSDEAATLDKGLHRAFYGVVKADADIPSELHGKKVMFKKRSRGGSVWGVNPVARANAIKVLSTASADCTDLGGGLYKCKEVGTDEITDITDASLLSFVSDVGVSDVAPFMFKEPFNTEYDPAKGKVTPQLSNTETARLTSAAVSGLMMGVSATNAVPASTHIAKAAYGSMLQGNLANWSQLDVTMPAGKDGVVVCRRVPGSGTQTSYNWYFNNFPCTGSSLKSGVDGTLAPARMKVKNLLDLQKDMADGTPGKGVPDCQDNNKNGACDAGEPTGGSSDRFIVDLPADSLVVVENSSSGQVRGCMEKAQAGSNHDFDFEDGKKYRVNFGTGGYGAVAVLSVDSGGLESGWSFRGMDGAGSLAKLVLDADKTQPDGPGSWDRCTTGLAYTGTGVAPKVDQLREGNYDFVAEVTMQYRSEDVQDAGDTVVVKKLIENTDDCNLGAACIADDGESLKYKFVSMFIARAGHPDFQTCATAALPVAYDPLAGTTDEDTATEEYDARRVAKAMRNGDGSGNMCAPLVRLY